MRFTTVFSLLATAALATAAATPDKGRGKDDPTKCNDKHPENCGIVSEPGAIVSPTIIEPSSTLPRLSTTTYTTSFCSVVDSVPFTTSRTYWEQSCTQIPRETVWTDYELKWGCATSTVTAVATMEDRRGFR